MQNTLITIRPRYLSKIQNLFTRTYESKFVRNIVVLCTGTAVAQAINIIFAPFLTRLYGPEAFGLLGTFAAIAAAVTPMASLSFSIAILLPKEDMEAKKIARLSAFIALLVAFLVALMLLVAGSPLVNILQVRQITSIILLIPLVIIVSAWFQINQQWLIRKKKFKIMARVAIFHAFQMNSAKDGGPERQ